MPRLIAAIIRHGDYYQLADTPSALQPFPLTEKGFQQAREGARAILGKLDEENWALATGVDSSLQLRAWQTADTIVQEINRVIPTACTLSSHAALAERSVGSAGNLTHRQIAEVVRQDPRFPDLPDNWKADSHFRLPLQGAESMMEAGKRVAEHLGQRMESLRQSINEDTLCLFVGHGASFRHAAHLLGVLDFEDIARLSMYHARPVYLEVSPDGAWSHIAGEWKIRPTDSRDLD
jgi:2,3-bisphosphoglycerate-dependent phosphoglycerate mutase